MGESPVIPGFLSSHAQPGIHIAKMKDASFGIEKRKISGFESFVQVSLSVLSLAQKATQIYLAPVVKCAMVAFSDINSYNNVAVAAAWTSEIADLLRKGQKRFLCHATTIL